MVKNVKFERYKKPGQLVPFFGKVLNETFILTIPFILSILLIIAILSISIIGLKIWYDKQLYANMVANMVISNQIRYTTVHDEVNRTERDELGWNYSVYYSDLHTIEKIVQSKSLEELIDIPKDNPLLPEVLRIIEARRTGRQQPPTFN